MSKNTAEFAIGGDLMIGKFPHIPIRFRLANERRRGLGVTDDDDADLLERAKAKEAGEEIEEEWEPTNEPDMVALMAIMAAAVGVCWPNQADLKGCPTLRECRHDVVEYGMGVLDELVIMYTKRGTPKIRQSIYDAGSKLIQEMNAAANEILVSEVAAEKVFTKAPEATGTDG